jgi:histidine ammonia-lyase
MRQNSDVTHEPGVVSSAVKAVLRTRVEGPGTDRYLAPEISAAHDLVVSGALLAAARTVVEDNEGVIV